VVPFRDSRTPVGAYIRQTKACQDSLRTCHVHTLAGHAGRQSQQPAHSAHPGCLAPRLLTRPVVSGMRRRCCSNEGSLSFWSGITGPSCRGGRHRRCGEQTLLLLALGATVSAVMPPDGPRFASSGAQSPATVTRSVRAEMFPTLNVSPALFALLHRLTNPFCMRTRSGTASRPSPGARAPSW
jgi:hypothetical protein